MQRLLDHDDLTALGVKPKSRSHRWQLMREGKFPKPIRIGNNTYWLADEVEAWQADRIAAAIAQRDAAK